MFNLLYLQPTHFTGQHHGAEYETSYEGVITKLRKVFADHEEGEDAYTQFYTYQECQECHGSRINENARSVRVTGLLQPCRHSDTCSE